MHVSLNILGGELKFRALFTQAYHREGKIPLLPLAEKRIHPDGEVSDLPYACEPGTDTTQQQHNPTLLALIAKISV